MATYSTKKKSAGLLLTCVGLTALLLGALSPLFAAKENTGSEQFDHLTTGFALDGAHAYTPCETCHIRGIFKGTPTQCEVCHVPGNRAETSVKPGNHIITNAPCSECHRSTVTWSGGRYSHAGTAPGSCPLCHDGNRAIGKFPGHIPTTASCDVCHRTTFFKPTR